jgi:hypothetical protein
MPVVAIPSIKYFCAQKNSTTGGIIETNDNASKEFQWTLDATISIDNRNPKATGYLITLLM